MGRDHRYVPGSFYRIDDRTGFAVRAERTKKEWTGRIVRDISFETRQPQDFVRGRADNQNVPEPRPRQTDRFLSTTRTLSSYLVSSDQQAANWPGLVSGPGFVVGAPGGKALMQLGGAVDSSTYLVPPLSLGTLACFDAGSVRNLQLNVILSYLGWPNAQGINQTGVTPIYLFTSYDLFLVPDLFGVVPVGSTTFTTSQLPLVWTAFVDARVEIATAGNDGVLGEWKRASNTIYNCRYVALRVWFSTYDQNTSVFVLGFTYQIAAA